MIYNNKQTNRQASKTKLSTIMSSSSSTNVPLPPEAEVLLTKKKVVVEEEAVPYIWDECQPPSEETLQVWIEVGNKLDKEATGE